MATILAMSPELQTLQILSMLIKGCLGHEILVCRTKTRAFSLAKEQRPHLILIDQNLAKTAKDFLASEDLSTIPIMFLTNKGKRLSKNLYLPNCAGDLPKPQVETVGSFLSVVKGFISTTAQLEVGDVILNVQGKSIESRHGDSVTLGRHEIQLIYILMAQPNRPHSVDELMREIWGDTWVESRKDPSNLRHLVVQLRRKLRRSGIKKNVILTRPGGSYEFRS